MTPHTRELTFYFDYISNNAYLAWTQLPRLQRTYGVTIRPVPVLFAGLLKAHGSVGPAEQPAKLMWMYRNVLRKAAHIGVPISPPKHHPFNPLLALRASSVDMDDDTRWQFIDGLFRAVWVDRLHVSDPGDVLQVAAAAGLDGEAIIRTAGTTDMSARLRQQTEHAIARGVFGVPTMIVGDELFFGYDDFPYLEMVLSGDDPLDPVAIERWHNTTVTPSAMRKEVRANPHLRQE